MVQIHGVGVLWVKTCQHFLFKSVASQNYNFLFYYQMTQTLLKGQMAKTEGHRLLSRANRRSLQRVANPVNEADGTSCFQCRRANQLALQVILALTAISVLIS